MNTKTFTLLKKTALRVVCPVTFMLLWCGTALSQPLTLNLPLSKSKGATSNTAGERNAPEPKGVDLCLFQRQYVAGVTNPKGVQLGEAEPLDYVHLKPTFTLAAKHVKSVELIESNPPFANDIDYFTLNIEFSELGREQMFAAFEKIQPVEYVAVVNKRAFPVRIAFRAKTLDQTIKKMSLGYFVDRPFGQSFVDALNPMAAATRREMSKQLYLPTVVGTKRVMQSTAGDGNVNDATETVAKVEVRNGKYVVTIARETSEKEVGDGGRFSESVYELSSKGVFTLFTTADGKLATPEPLLKLPARVADMWTHEHLDGNQGMTRTGNFTVWGPEVIKVPAGRFETIAVHKQYVWKRNGEQVEKSKSTTWYALGVGVVKHVSDNDGERKVTVLKEFTLGKAK